MPISSEAPYTSARRDFAQLTDGEKERLFHLPAICQTVFLYLRQMAQTPWSVQETAFLDASSSQRAEWLFANRLLASYGSMKQHIQYTLDSTPPTLQLDELCEQLKELILQFSGTAAGKKWMTCLKTDSESWRYIARFMFSEASKLSTADHDEFFEALNKIAIIHDLIKGRGRKYGINFRPTSDESVERIKQYCHSPQKAREILEQLHQRIDRCKGAKGASMPVRAMMTIGVLTERLPWSIYQQEFGEDNNNKNSYNEYTNADKQDPFKGEELYESMKKDFKELL